MAAEGLAGGAWPSIPTATDGISIVIGYQGVAQLRPYGSESFTINLVAVSVVREMGVLLLRRPKKKD